jgi:hypothetical protein
MDWGPPAGGAGGRRCVGERGSVSWCSRGWRGRNIYISLVIIITK